MHALTVKANLLMFRIDLDAHAAHNAAVNRDAALPNQVFAVATARCAAAR
jgi:hypothetical protein